MCGIGGILGNHSRREEALDALGRALSHRGPDGAGRFERGPAALVHTRLAILDTAEAAAQPMASPRGFGLVFNGEIYNHGELRGQASLPSKGDAATLLHLLEQRGEKALPSLQGMFAIALLEPGGSLLLARDAFGQKPLYYVHKPGLFGFASEIRALRVTGLASDAPDFVALGALAQKGSLPGTHTHLADVSMLPPGCWMRVNAGGGLDGPHAYFKPDWTPRVHSFNEAAELLAPLLLSAARRALLADVPIAAFLSGGLDSTSVCALLMAAGARGLRTFCVAVPGTVFDESRFAARAASFLGTEHKGIELDEASGRALISEAERCRDAPGIDGANTFIVAKCVRREGFKVAQSGLGGDELFGGYPSFADARRWASAVNALGRLPGAGAIRALSLLGGKLGRVGRASQGRLDAAALYCARRSLTASYFRKIAPSWASEALRHASAYDYAGDVRSRCQAEINDAGNRALEFEQRVYLHDQLLRDSDQFGMACGLEIRAPLLDTDLALACAGIPGAIKAQRGKKGLLLAAVEKATGLKLPREISARRKQGFMLPLEAWSRG